MQAPPVYSPSVRYHAGNAMIAMLDALVRALSQMVSPEFRAILWKSVAYALVLIVLIAVGVAGLGRRELGRGRAGWLDARGTGRARVDPLRRCGNWDRHRVDIPDAGRHRPGGKLLRR